jgi:hypothetical protein
MRGGVLLAEENGRSGWLVPDPVEVQASNDGRVILVDGEGHTRTGWLPSPMGASTLGLQNVFPALGLFAQTEGSVKLAPDGPIVGRVAAGAFVPIRSLGHEWAAMDLPFVERGHRRNLPEESASYGSIAFDDERFFVPISVLGLERKPVATGGAYDWIPKHGHVLRLGPERTSRTFAVTWCLPGKVIEAKNNGERTEQRVRYHFEGIEIEGWTDRPFLEGHTDTCSRYVDERFQRLEQRDRDPMNAAILIPAGFQANRFVPEKNPLPQILVDASRRQKALWIPVVRKARLECARYRLGRHKKGSLYLAAAPPPDPEILRLEFSVALGPDRLGLLGPSTDTKEGRSMVAGCSNEYRFVRADSRVLEMIPSHLGVSSYHPDDVETWYADQRTCTERATFKQASSACE